MKYRTNITASSNKHAPAHTRLRARREVIRRSRLVDGMIRIEFVKILPPDEWSASLKGEIPPPWPGGAA